MFVDREGIPDVLALAKLLYETSPLRPVRTNSSQIRSGRPVKSLSSGEQSEASAFQTVGDPEGVPVVMAADISTLTSSGTSDRTSDGTSDGTSEGTSDGTFEGTSSQTSESIAAVASAIDEDPEPKPALPKVPGGTRWRSFLSLMCRLYEAHLHIVSVLLSHNNLQGC